MNELVRCTALATILFGAALPVMEANDSAASTGAGGIQLRREANVSMEKEVLTISEAKVTVEYEFLNESDQDITTDVAFPIPPYGNGFVDAAGRRDFNDFHLWIEGKPLKYETEVRADLNGKDQTEVLKKLGIDIASLGALRGQCEVGTHGTSKFSQPRGALRSSSCGWGLVSGAERPADLGNLFGKVFENLLLDADLPVSQNLCMFVMNTRQLSGSTRCSPIRLILRFARDGCRFSKPRPSPQQSPSKGNRLLRLRNSTMASTIPASAHPYKKQSWMRRRRSINLPKILITMIWVDYILTTASSWKTPIKDFTLIVDSRPAPILGRVQPHAAFCWDGETKKLDASRVQAHAVNFVPKKELHVAFFSLPEVPE